MGDGADNGFITEGSARDVAAFAFPQVKFVDNVRFVMHPFENGQPNVGVDVGLACLAR